MCRTHHERTRFLLFTVIVVVLASTARSEPPGIAPNSGFDQAVPALRKALDDEQLGIRVLAACALVDLGAVDRQVIDVLVKGLDANDAAVVAAGLRGLAQLGPRAQPAIPAVMCLLERGELEQQTAAGQVVVAVGRPAVPELGKMLRHDDPDVQRRAVEVAVEMGYAARPLVSDLTGMLGAEDPLLRAAVIDAVGRIGRVVRKAEAEAARALQYARWKDEHERRKIFEQISADGADALVDAVIRDPESLQVHYPKVRFALAAIGRPAIPACLRLAEEPDVHQYRVATDAFARMGGLAGPAVAPLLTSAEQFDVDDVEAYQKTDNQLGRNSRYSELVATLRQIGSHDLPAVRQAFTSDKPAVRAAAVATFSEECLTAWDDFAGLLDDHETCVRLATLQQMWNLKEHAAPALPRLQRMLRDDHPEIRRMTASVIGRFGHAGRPAVPDLVDRLHDDEQRVRAEAATSLSRLGQPGWDAMRNLLDSDRDVDRLRAVEAIAVYRGSNRVDRWARQEIDRAVLAPIAALLHDTNDRLPSSVERTLRIMLDDASTHHAFPVYQLRREIIASAGDRMIELAEENLPARVEAIRFLAAGWHDLETADHIRRALAVIAAGCYDENADVRRITVLALATMRHLPQGAVDRLLAGLHDKVPAVRAAAAQSLWALLKGCHPETYIPHASSGSWGGDGMKLPRHDEFITGLVALLNEKHPPCRRCAAQALGAMGSDARTALPALRKLAQDPDEQVREAVVHAIAWIDRGANFAGEIRLRSESLDQFRLPPPAANR